MKYLFIFCCLVFVIVGSGCGTTNPPTTATALSPSPHEEAQNENNLFLQQKSFDPWKLNTTDPSHAIPAYLATGSEGSVYDSSGTPIQTFESGKYDANGVIVSTTATSTPVSPASAYSQILDLQKGTLTTEADGAAHVAADTAENWPEFWNNSDITIAGDSEAQQVTHAELFTLCSSVDKGTDHSVPPMGLSSNVYAGHIFWDAEIWMLPALLPQHPELARTIVDYRFNRLKAAETLAKQHGFAGAEYPWESAATGLEQAPEEFSHERHITGDVAYAAWQYYLWTGDQEYLRTEGWPVISATANYWVSRAELGGDEKYHIANVVGPDETAGQVTDDAWTNGVAQYNLQAALLAAAATGNPPNPAWSVVADRMSVPYDPKDRLYLQFPKMDIAHQQAKQADTQMLIFPLGYPMSAAVAGNTLDFYLKHTIVFGPAMTSSINAVIAARLGRAAQSLSLYQDSYRPFMRGPWDAFSEKRTKSDVYFNTGIGGSLQCVLYGFAGLNVVGVDKVVPGTLVAVSGDAALYCDPHLPAGWTALTVKGVQFRRATYTIAIASGNQVTVTKQ